MLAPTVLVAPPVPPPVSGAQTAYGRRAQADPTPHHGTWATARQWSVDFWLS